MINGHDLEKKRVCELKRGDEFIFYGRERRVTSVERKVRFIDEHGYPNHLGAKSQQWVELMKKPQPKFIRAKW